MRINSLGQVLTDLSPLSRKQLAAYLRTLLYLACDLDGCVIPKGGLETAGNKATVAKFLSRNKFAAAMFRDIATILVQDGIKIGICTGRSATFAKKIVKEMFIPGTCGFMVAEGGAVKSFFNPSTGEWTDEVPMYLDKEDVTDFLDTKDIIISIGTEKLGGFLETGKSIITSFNPPAGMSVKDYRHAFEHELNNLGVIDALNVEDSSSAVDIGPRGSNKAACLQEIVGSAAAHTAVLVDANNDEGVTKQFLVNLMPNNAQEGIQDLGMQAMLSLKSDFDDLYGTINLFMKIKELRGY